MLLKAFTFISERDGCSVLQAAPLYTYVVGISYVKCIRAVDNNKAQPVWFGGKFSVTIMFLGLYM